MHLFVTFGFLVLFCLLWLFVFFYFYSIFGFGFGFGFDFDLFVLFFIVLQFLLFVPLLSMDEHRQLQNRNFCFCCFKHSASKNSESFAMNELEMAGNQKDILTSGSRSRTQTETQTEIKTTQETTDEENRNDNEENIERDLSAQGNMTFGQVILANLSFEAVISNLIVPLHEKKLFRIIIIIIFFLFNIASIISLQWLDSTSDSSKFVPDDSHVITWNEAVVAGFGEVSFTLTSVILEHTDFSNKTTRSKVETLIAELEAYNTTHGQALGTLDTWYWAFLTWVNDSLVAEAAEMNETDYRTIDDITRIEFYDYLQEFANDTTQTAYARWDSVLVYGYEEDDDNDDEEVIFEVEATKWYIFTNKAAKLGDIWPFKEDLDELMQDTLETKDGFYTDDFFPWAYLESVIVSLTVTNMGFALLGVLIVMVLLMDLKMSLFITFVVIMIDVGMYSFLCLFF